MFKKGEKATVTVQGVTYEVEVKGIVGKPKEIKVSENLMSLIKDNFFWDSDGDKDDLSLIISESGRGYHVLSVMDSSDNELEMYFYHNYSYTNCIDRDNVKVKVKKVDYEDITPGAYIVITDESYFENDAIIEEDLLIIDINNNGYYRGDDCDDSLNFDKIYNWSCADDYNYYRITLEVE